MTGAWLPAAFGVRQTKEILVLFPITTLIFPFNLNCMDLLYNICALNLNTIIPGTCFIFAPLGSMTAVNRIMTGQSINLSAQQVLDCHTVTSAGEKGGWPFHVLDFAMKAGGILCESSYRPFSGVRGVCQSIQVCHVILLIV